jgi:hypothetical protein
MANFSGNFSTLIHERNKFMIDRVDLLSQSG